MKILHVINDLKMGGAETMLVNFCRLMAEWGHPTDVLVLGEPTGPIPERIRAAGAGLHWTGFRTAYDVRNILALRRFVRCGGYEVVHVHLFPSQLWAAIALGQGGGGMSTVTTEHSTWNRRRDASPRWVFRGFERWMYGRFTRIVAISDGVKSALLSWLDSSRLAVDVVVNGIDLQPFRGAQPVDRLPGEQRFKAICVATLAGRKNHSTLLEALPDVPGVDLVLVGDGPLRSDLQQQAKRLKIQDRVHFLGSRNDIPALLAAADFYVQPSTWEGFGLSALEAMASGLPVIASDTPGLAEVVGDAGLLVERFSPDAWRSAILRVIADADLRLELRERAPRQAARFRVEQTVERYLDLYASCSSSVGKPRPFSLPTMPCETKELSK